MASFKERRDKVLSSGFFTPEAVSKAVQGRLVTWNSKNSVKNFTNKLNSITEGSLFFLFNDCENEDEDELIARFSNYNAAGIICDRKLCLNTEKWSKAGLGIIQVVNLNSAYLAMAKLYRSKFSIAAVQVVGSSGKTTAKEMIGSILSYNMPVLTGAGNLNSPLHIAYQISKLKDIHQAAVFEAGMKARGIIKLSSSIIKPTIGIITSIHRSHFTRIGSMEQIIAAKAELLEYLDEDGSLIINGEDKNCIRLPLESYKGEILTFGFTEKCNIWADNIICKEFRTYFNVHTGENKFECSINTVARYNISNALAAVMVGLKLGISPENIVKGLSTFKPLSARLEILQGIKNTTLVNDNFNANPDSTKMMLKEVSGFAGGRPVILVMGDMENPRDEISEYAHKEHFKTGQLIGKMTVRYLFAIGKWAAEYVRGAITEGMNPENISYFRNPDDAENTLKKFLIPGSIIIFKASTYVKLKNLINSVKVK